jgi:hypothetical protein
VELEFMLASNWRRTVLFGNVSASLRKRTLALVWQY